MTDFFRISQSSFRDADRLKNAINLAHRMFPKVWEKALHDAGDIAHKFFDRQFASQGSEFGTPWKPLALSTQRDRKRKGYKPARPILVRRGWLRASVASKASANAKRVVTQTGIAMWSSLETKSGHNLLVLHQKRTKFRPARKIYREGNPLFISERGWQEIQTRFLGMFIEIRREMERQ